MQHLFSYSLSDFLLFSPETYFRLFERYNEALWPLQILSLALALLVLWLGARQQGLRIIALIFALAWIVVGWAFFWERYQTINWAGSYFAFVALIQAVLLLDFARRPPGFSRRAHRSGLLLIAFAVILQPLIGPLSGKAWLGIELFGMAPDPTAVATVGFSLLVSGLRRWLVLPIAVTWCAITAATAFEMAWPAGMIGPAVAMAVLLLGYPLQARRPASST